MKKILSVLVVLTFALYGVFSITPTSPVFLWSNTHIFKERNLQEIEILSAREISNGLQNMESPISQYMNGNVETTELIIIFVEPELTSEQMTLLAHSHQSTSNGGAFSNLKRLVETSKSSLTIPYGTASSLGSSLVRSLASSLSPKGSVYVVGENSNSNIETPNKLTLSELKSKLKDPSWEPLNNGVADLLVIPFHAPAVPSNIDDSSVHTQFAEDDATVSTIVESITSKYLAIFTSDSVTNYIYQYTEKRGQPELRSFEQRFAQGNNVLFFSNWPDVIVQGLLVMLPFIGILFVGICCTANLQSNLKFDAEKSILRKH